ncbi:hypothetical protein [Kurthia massiliensis]|uniref:hypothetical protein n=1 Tax=Kurthia massiliensis TaxID=1033739 RepID=UPI00028A0C65|nr:hypothetical protein [Kurthia massiliensis]
MSDWLKPKTSLTINKVKPPKEEKKVAPVQNALTKKMTKREIPNLNYHAERPRYTSDVRRPIGVSPDTKDDIAEIAEEHDVKFNMMIAVMTLFFEDQKSEALVEQYRPRASEVAKATTVSRAIHIYPNIYRMIRHNARVHKLTIRELAQMMVDVYRDRNGQEQFMEYVDRFMMMD